MDQHKTYFLHSDICLKLYVPHYASHCTKEFLHSYCFMKLTTLYISRIKQIYTKPLNVSESTLQTNVNPRWVLF